VLWKYNFNDKNKDNKKTSETNILAKNPWLNFEWKHPRGVRLMTIHLLDLYKQWFPMLMYEDSMKPQRILTELPEGPIDFSLNHGYDLPNGDYIIK